MERIDFNCLLGQWPFRKIYKNTFEDLKRVHADNRISYGYVSSLNSIFYNDPFEGDEEIHELIRNSAYRHVMTINPLLPHFIEDIRRGTELFGISGVRIYPGYHGYRLDSAPVDELCGALREYGLPLFLSIRLEDARLNYLIKPETPDITELSAFLEKHPDNEILLLSAYYHELLELKDMINARANVFFDASGLKDLLFVVEKLLAHVNASRMVYGSQHPLYCLRSTALLIEKAQIETALKEKIFAGSNFGVSVG